MTKPRLWIPAVAGMSTLEAAFAYADGGWYVLPVANGSKHPGSVVGKRWQATSTKDHEQIAAWFAGTSHGIALHVGRSGAVVFDIDKPDAVPAVLTEAIAAEGAPFQTTRRGEALRGHAVFCQPDGRAVGNSTGALGQGWGEVRGVNGVIIVEPSTHANATNGGEYQWAQTGVVPALPAALAEQLPDAATAVDAVSDGRVRAFLDRHDGHTDSAAFGAIRRRWEAQMSAGASRHDTAVTLMCWAMRDARAGWYPAKQAEEELRGLFMDAVAMELPGKRARTGGRAENEWRGIVAYGVGAAEAEDIDAYKARAASRGVGEGAFPFGPSQDMETELDAKPAKPAKDPAKEGQNQDQDQEPVNPSQTDLLVEAFFGRTKTTADMRTQPPPRWLIGGLVTQGSLVQAFGRSGSFKSFYTLDMALCLATKTRFHGRDVAGGPVYYVAAEGAAGMGQRVRAWEKAYGIEVPDISADGGVRWVDWALQLTSAQDYTALRAAAAREKPVAIFLDTRHRVSVGLNENDAQDTGLLIGRLDKIREDSGAALVLVHHTGHSEQDRGRGSSAAYAALDAEIKIERRGKSPQVTVESTKAKDWGEAEPEQFVFTAVDVPVDGDPMATSGVLKKVAAPAAADELPVNVSVLEAVAELADDGRGSTPTALSVRLGMRKQRLQPVLDRQVNAGRLRVADGPRGSKLYSLSEKGAKWLADRRQRNGGSEPES